MLSLKQAVYAADFDALLNLVYFQSTTCLKPKLDLVQLAAEQFGEYFRQTGQAYRIDKDGHLVGLCWVELKGSILFLHGLIVRPEFQGQGIGAWALTMLVQTYLDRVEAIELLVHSSNPRARSLYEREGYRVMSYQPASGFFLMRKELVALPEYEVQVEMIP